MSNPYQSFFDKLDKTIADLEGCERHDAVTDTAIQDAVDLLRRSGYVLANTLNVQANTLPVLVLEPEPETVQGEAREADDASAPPLGERQEAPE
ncbi:MAG TPA: hypothetical protein VFH56_11480 [Acidimicrobiales bacterium]|nr:hypothetical protein [Acidimicrobiales bacterium]